MKVFHNDPQKTMLLKKSIRQTIYALGMFFPPLWHMLVRQQLRRARQKGQSVKVLLGSGARLHEGWISTDVPLVDVLDRDSLAQLFTEASVDCFMAEHVWEHLTLEQGQTALQNLVPFLRPGSHVRLAVPDGLHPDPTYIAAVRPGGNGPGAEDHKLLYTYHSLSEMVENSGYIPRLLEYYDEAGRFRYEPWFTSGGPITRSLYNDPRNLPGELKYSSLIIDCIKPTA